MKDKTKQEDLRTALSFSALTFNDELANEHLVSFITDYSNRQVLSALEKVKSTAEPNPTPLPEQGMNPIKSEDELTIRGYEKEENTMAKYTLDEELREKLKVIYRKNQDDGGTFYHEAATDDIMQLIHAHDATLENNQQTGEK